MEYLEIPLTDCSHSKTLHYFVAAVAKQVTATDQGSAPRDLGALWYIGDSGLSNAKRAIKALGSLY